MFQGSVFDNIAQGLIGTELQTAPRDVQMAKVQEAAKVAFAHDFISELPEGYDTQIGQRGGLLSGGQKQRVAIARSVVSEPTVLLLDEATSALDPHAETIVQQALDRASQGRTTIVIAHKLATIRKADNIVVMKKGQILEQGTHESLLASDGIYAQLVKIQNLAPKPVETDSDSDDLEDPVEKGDTADAIRPLSRLISGDVARMELQKDRDDYEKHKQLGMIAVIFRLVKEFPELRWPFFLVFIGCLGACE